MTAKVASSPVREVDTLVQLSIELDRLCETLPLTKLFLRSLESPSEAFVRRDAQNWFARSLERLQTRGAKVTLYSLDANIAHFHTLMEAALKGPLEVTQDTAEKLVRRFQNSVPLALKSLQERMEALVKASKNPSLQEKMAKTRTVFDAAFKTHFEADLVQVARSFLKDDHFAVFTSSLVRELFEQYTSLMNEINRRIGEGIASREEADLLRARLQKEALQFAEKRLELLFRRFQEESIKSIQSARTIEAFHGAKSAMQIEIARLIELDRAIHGTPLCALFCTKMKAFGAAIQQIELPRYGELIQKEVFPEITRFLKESEANRNPEELELLQAALGKYIAFLEEAACQLMCPNGVSSCPESELLDKAISMLKDGQSSIKAKIYQSRPALQSISGEKNSVIMAHTITINNRGQNSQNSTDQGFIDQVFDGVVPSSMGIALRYGSTVLVSAAATYLTGGLSLGWSLVSGVAFTAAPAAAKAAARQVLPGVAVGVLDPMIDFAARLLVWRYGTSTIQMMAGVQEPALQPAAAAPQGAMPVGQQPQPAAAVEPQGVLQRVIDLPAVPIVMGTLDVVQRVRSKGAGAAALKPFFSAPSLDTPGIIGRSVAYLSALFWLSKQHREISLL